MGKTLVSKASWTHSNFDEWHHVTVWRQQMWSVAAFELCSTLWWSWTWNPSLILLWTLPHCTLWPVGAYTQSCLLELQWIWNWVSVVLRLSIGHCLISCSGCEEFYLCWCLCHQCLFSVEGVSLSRAGQRRGCVCLILVVIHGFCMFVQQVLCITFTSFTSN